MNIDSSPPAFPIAETPGVSQGWSGMSLRQYYAGQALVGAMSGAQGLGDVPPEERARQFAAMADILFEFADAMIAAGKQ